MAEIEFIPREQWASLPVQPTAGAWRRRRRMSAFAVAAAGLWAIVVATAVITGSADAGLHLWDPLVPFALILSMGTVMAVRQARAERTELRHGYTTVPGHGRPGAR